MWHSLRTLLVTSAVGLAAAGCGTSSGPTDTLLPADAVRAAVSTTTQQTSSHLTVTTTSHIGPATVDITMDGLYDYAHRTGRMSMTIPGSDRKLDEILTPTTVYLKVPPQPGYFAIPVSKIVGTSLGSNTDPTAGLQSLLGLSDGVRSVGQEQVRGDETTHYVGTYDLSKAVEKVHGLVKQMITSQLGAGSSTTVPFDAFVDTKGRVRKLVQKLTLTSPKLPGQTITSTVTTEFYDFGVPVQVTAPTDVRDGSRLLDAFTRQLGTSG